MTTTNITIIMMINDKLKSRKEWNGTSNRKVFGEYWICLMSFVGMGNKRWIKYIFESCSFSFLCSSSLSLYTHYLYFFFFGNGVSVIYITFAFSHFFIS